jgi:type I restriction enzyme R subunit
MERGLKIEGGDRLGRTIIFAVNQTHARFIVDCFTERYPEQVPGFIEMITNEVSHSQSLITAFCDKHKENLPMIAVSVDMMDTGIDAPRVLNLVFFKVVRSYAKFWQMIGRGTRLCPDIFGPNLDKEHFLIFDVCGNFDFFSAAKSKDDTHLGKPITQQLFDARLHLSRLLVEGGQEEEITLAGAIRDLLHISIEKLDRKRFQVSMKMRYVEEFQNRSRWNNLDSQDVHVIEQHLSELPTPEMVNELARRFDLMMVKLQIATLMMSSSRRKFESGLMEIAEGLSQKYTIPAISKARATIESLRDPDFYKNLTQKKLESIREELRDLVQYLDATNRPVFYSNITDSDVLVIESVPDMSINYGTLYRKRVESYIREHRHDLVISKLSSNQPITAAELVLLEKILFDGTDRGTLVDFKREYGDAPLGVFIRGILGLETKAAQDAFAEFLQAGNLRADQMTFIQNIINFLTRNGTVEPSMLFEPPFTDLNDQGLMGVFDDGASHKIISIVERINSNAIGA